MPIQVENSGIVFEKCTNGVIVVTSGVGPGMITLKNCKNISVVMECNAYLLLDKNTELESLYVKENAVIDSLENFQAELSKKNTKQKKRPLVRVLMQEEGLNPVFNEIEIRHKIEIPSEKNTSTDLNKLKITRDESYKGLGVRFIIENRPEAAESLNVILRTNGSEKAIDYISKKNHPDRFYSDTYEYTFLDPNKEYEFVFWYTNNKETIIKYYIKAVTNKGIFIGNCFFCYK